MTAEEIGRTSSTTNAFLPAISRDYAYIADSTSLKSNSVKSTDIIELLFQNKALIEIKNNIVTGFLPRKHPDLLSIEEQAIVALGILT